MHPKRKPITVTLLCLFFFLPISPGRIPAAEPPAEEQIAPEVNGLPLLFHETFEQGAARWLPTDRKAWKIVDEEGDRVFSLHRSSEYRPPVRSPHSIAWIEGLDVADFVVEARMKQTGREYGHRDLCVFFGRRDAAHFYYVHIATKADAHANSIFIVDGKPRLSIATERTSGTDWATGYHRVRVERESDSGAIRVYFNDMKTPIMTARDRTFLSGGIGFGSFDDTGCIDDVRVWGRPATPEPFYRKQVVLMHPEGPGAFAIPKLVTTPAGTAIVVFQARQGGDWGKRIDPLAIRSDDGGRTWSEPALLIPKDFPRRDAFHIKPTGIVVDRRAGRIHVFVSRSPLVNAGGKAIHERWFYGNIGETRRLGRAWFHVTSDDEGAAWSAPREITAQLIVQPHWQEWSPVHTGLQLAAGKHAGRLVVPVRCYCPEEDPSRHTLAHQHNGVIFSDDGGETWIPGGRSEPRLGECSIAEALDGTLHVNHRTSRDPARKAERMQSTSRDGGATFSACLSSGLRDARCHAGLARIAGPDGRYRFLLSSVPGPKRKGLAISVSDDEGRTWKTTRTVDPGHTAYSDLAVLPDGMILCVYETGAKSSRRDLAVARFNLAWVLAGE